MAMESDNRHVSRDFASDFLESLDTTDVESTSDFENSLNNDDDHASIATDQHIPQHMGDDQRPGNINDVDGEVDGPVQGAPQLPDDVCHKHGNKPIEMYCATHAMVGCIVCLMGETHNNCSKKFIPDVADPPEEDIEGLVQVLHKLKNETKFLREETDQDLTRLCKEKNNALQEIDNCKDILIAKIQELSNKAKAVVEAEYKLQEYRIKEIANKIENKQTELEARIGRLSESNANKAQVFVDYVNGLASRDKTKVLVKNLEKTPKLKTIQFVMNNEIHDVVRDCSSFGELRSEFQTHTTLETSLPNLCHDFIGCCVLQDGSLVLADQRNMVLQKLNHRIEPVANINLHHVPGGICDVKQRQIAVTLPAQMRIIFVNETMEQENRFGVGMFCYGIQYYNGRIYVVCRQTEEPGSSPDEIRVFNKVGVFQTAIRRTLREMKPSGNVSISRDGSIPCDGPIPPAGLFNIVSALASDKKHLYIASPTGAILQLNSRHRVVSIKSDEQLKGISGVACCRSSLYVCNRDTCKILTIGVDGTLNDIRTLLTEDQGINIPNAVCVNGSKLIVLLTDSNSVLQFETVAVSL